MSIKNLPLEERRAYFRTHKRLSRAKLRGEISSEEVKRRNREQYLKNKERYKAKAKEWNKTHVEYSRAQSAQNRVKQKYPETFAISSIDLDSMEQWFMDQRGKACSYCGKATMPVMDHVIPLSRGGKHELDNLKVCCSRCNSFKGAQTLEEFTEEIRQMYEKLCCQRNLQY